MISSSTLSRDAHSFKVNERVSAFATGMCTTENALNLINEVGGAHVKFHSMTFGHIISRCSKLQNSGIFRYRLVIIITSDALGSNARL
jgi:hypothetical protein